MPAHYMLSGHPCKAVTDTTLDRAPMAMNDSSPDMALPDVYDLASVIESVVSPQHTCILVNTTHTLGVESYLEQRFPTNVVLSLVSGTEFSQLGAAEFEHKGAAELWVGAANKNPSIPMSIQQDMAEALAMTLKSGQVDCEVSPNIRQQQYDKMIGPIAFHPASVIFETSSHAELLEKTGVRTLIAGVISELMTLAQAQDCTFRSDFCEHTMEQMILPSESSSMMYQDFAARRPMEVETYLGSPIKQAQALNMAVPRIETLYALLHSLNIVNQTRPVASNAEPAQTAPPFPGPPPRMSSAPGPRGLPYGAPAPMNGAAMRNGMRPSSRAPSMTGGPPPPNMRRGPPSMNGYPPPRNGSGYGPRGGSQQISRRPSVEGNDLEEFSHVVLYDNVNDDSGYDGLAASSTGDLALRQRELALRQKELALRDREYNLRRGPGPRGILPRRSTAPAYDDDEDGEDFFDPMAGTPGPPIDAENFDMMSVTSRRTRKTPSATQLRNDPEMGGPPGRGNRNPWKRNGPAKNRTSAALMGQMPGLREELMNDPLMGYSSDRYGNVDRMNMGHESRTNSLTAERLEDLSNGPPGGYSGPRGGGPSGRRGSQSPGNPFGPGPGPQRGPPRMSPNGYGPGPVANGRPSPPGMRQPVPRHPPGHGNAVAPQQIEQQTGVSNLYPPKSGQQVRSLTGSASASAGSGDSNRSAPLDSEPSAHSSSSSLGPRQPLGVR
nr:meiotically up-regulated gene 72 protein [Quercus suber]